MGKREEIIADIEDHLTGVDEELRSFVANFKADILRKCVSNLYYACFHATRALLSTKGLYTKTHEGTIRMFSLHFVKSGVVDKRFSSYLSNLESRRADADYKKFIPPVDVEWLKEWSKWTEEFISMVVEHIKKTHPEVDTSKIEESLKKFVDIVKIH